MITSLPQFHYSHATRDGCADQLQHVNWRLIYGCNYKCPMCDYWRTQAHSDVSEFPPDHIRPTIAALSQAGLRFARLNGGEPTQHPSFGEFVKQLVSFGVLVEVVSNGSASLDQWDRWIDAGLSRVQLSIDSHRPDHAGILRGVPNALRVVRSVLEHIHHAHPHVHLMLNCVLTSLNYYDGFLFDYIDHFVDVGLGAVSFSIVDIKTRGREKPHQLEQSDIRLLSTAQIESFLTATRSLETQNMNYRDVHVTLNPFVPRSLDGAFRNRIRDFWAGRLGMHIYPQVACKQPWTGLSIIENGDCFPCLNTVYTPTYKLGNILVDPLPSIFNGAAMQEYRRRNVHGCNASCAVCKDHQQSNYYWSLDNEIPCSD